ncbi:MAG: hypothetical protein NPIRA04_31750 [Nitrospirales bacterium]|nr:MAG: hypothetical protein NPIRA04_31750 [Nitrospirales bacterium]
MANNFPKNISQFTTMKNNAYTSIILSLLIMANVGMSPSWSFATEPTGISRLIQVSESSIKTGLPSSTRPLFTASELEAFLHELEGIPPEWNLYHDRPGDELGERIFTLNRARDEARNGHQLLRQHIAFFWSGFLRKYDIHHQGFRVAVGPVLTQTKWGIVRFKPVNLPNDMLAVPSKKLLKILQAKISQGKQIEITILYTGHLIPHESLMYTFSHDDTGLGMILPFVKIDEVQYLVK